MFAASRTVTETTEKSEPLASRLLVGVAETVEVVGLGVAVPPPVVIPPIELHADVPDAVKEAVEAQIAAQVAAMRAQLEQQYAEKAQIHEEQIKTLEAAVAAK